jgi:hypothetical protein
LIQSNVDGSGTTLALIAFGDRDKNASRTHPFMLCVDSDPEAHFVIWGNREKYRR